MANRQVVQIEDISPHLLDAIIALEDNHFFSHHGSANGLFSAPWSAISLAAR
jgi:membrane peptidoglycan carboxypeptidase